MRIVVIGGGGREHALAWALSKEHEVVVTPGNPGIAQCGEILSRSALEIDADLFVIGPEAPLVDGLGDALRAQGKAVFGPSKEGARIEGSKAFMKDLLRSARVPTADYTVIDNLAEGVRYVESHDGPYVIKTDGLAAGKGVLVTPSREEALEDLRAKLGGESFGSAGRTVVIEEAMAGPEISLLAVTDGYSAVALPVATDYKRAYDGDAGPNTGGMGAHTPVPWAPSDVVEEIMTDSVRPLLLALRRRGIEYRGVLYAGMMLTPKGPKVVEFNIRFGDPEAQAVLPMISSGLGELLLGAARGRLDAEPVIQAGACLVVALTSRGYPGSVAPAERITGLEAAEAIDGVTVFHSGTTLAEGSGELVSAGGRVLTVSARGDTLLDARERAYRAVNEIHFNGAHYRRDIGLRALSTSTDTGV